MKNNLKHDFEYLKTKFEEASQKHNGFGNSEEMDLITKQMYDSVGFQKANEFFDHLDDLPCGLWHNRNVRWCWNIRRVHDCGKRELPF